MAKLHNNIYFVHLPSLSILCHLYISNAAISYLFVCLFHSCLNVTYLFPFLAHSVTDLWHEQLSVRQEVKYIILYEVIFPKGLIMIFEMAFRFGFRFGNNWFILGSSSQIFQFEICLQYFCFGVWHSSPLLLMVLNLTLLWPPHLMTLKV